jgi:hypothetical protein
MENNSEWIHSILPEKPSENNISKQQKTAYNEEFILKTQQQISKDFAKFNLEFRESFNLEPWKKEEIEVAIEENLVIIIKMGETKLMQLLYTIDIPEQTFLSLTQEKDFIQLLSLAILKREAMKVFFRSKF